MQTASLHHDEEWLQRCRTRPRRRREAEVVTAAAAWRFCRDAGIGADGWHEVYLTDWSAGRCLRRRQIRDRVEIVWRGLAPASTGGGHLQ